MIKHYNVHSDIFSPHLPKILAQQVTIHHSEALIN